MYPQTNRVLTYEEAAVIANIAALPPSGRVCRMTAFRSCLKLLPGFGPFDEKNYFEALITHGIWKTPTDREHGLLRDGPGANFFWRHTKITRPQMVTSIHNRLQALDAHARPLTLEAKDGSYQKTYTLKDLGIIRERDTEASCQFWACAQSRILLARSLIALTYKEPVPWFLRPNSAILDEARQAWAAIS